MCWAAAVPIALAGAQAIGQQSSQNQAVAAQTKAMRLQSREQLRAMNIQNADLSLQAQSQAETLQDDLTSNNLQKLQAMGSIRAAMGESMLEGNSMNRIANVTEGDYIREANKLTENYTRDYAAIFQQQVGLVESTKSDIRARNKAEPKMKSKLMQVLDPLSVMGSQAASAYASGQFDSKGGK